MKTNFKLIGIGFILMFVLSSGNFNHASAKNVMALKELPLNSAAYDIGIKFDSMSLAKAKEEAKKSNKLIFVFAYTDWCGSCNLMNRTSFKGVEVGKLYNENFVNLKIDVEKDIDGTELAQLYRVEQYPTLLFLDGNGKLIKQSAGKKSINQLIAIANSVL